MGREVPAEVGAVFDGLESGAADLGAFGEINVDEICMSLVN